jgi:hypothetical protein
MGLGLTLQVRVKSGLIHSRLTWCLVWYRATIGGFLPRLASLTVRTRLRNAKRMGYIVRNMLCTVRSRVLWYMMTVLSRDHSVGRVLFDGFVAYLLQHHATIEGGPWDGSIISLLSF